MPSNIITCPPDIKQCVRNGKNRFILESYPLPRYILGSGAPETNAVGVSGAINGMKR